MFGFKHGRLGSAGTRTLIQRAIASLRARGSDAHLWLPGVGTLNGLTTGNYLESTGNTLATVDNPTGLVLDALGSVGAELVTNGDFSQGTTGWTLGTGWAVADGKLSRSLTTGWETAQQNSLFVIDKTYRVTVNITSYTSGSLQVLPGTTDPITITPTQVGSYTFNTKATTANFWVRGKGDAGSFVGSIDNISVREVTGIHLTQGTTANKPVLRRGLWNNLLWSHDLTNAVWVKDANTTSVTGGEIVVNNTVHSQRQTFTVVAGNTYTLVLEAKRGTMTEAKTSIYNLTGTANIIAPSSFYSEINSSDYSYVVRTFTAPVGCTSIYAYALRDSGVIGSTFVRSLGLFQGTLTASQILAAGGIPVTTTAAASNPDAGKYSWSFDGSNDSLALGSVPFQMGDDHAVIAGFSTPSAASQTVASPAGKSAAYVKAATIKLTAVSGNVVAVWTSDAVTDYLASSSVSALGSTRVASALKRSNTGFLRVDGVQRSTVDLTACTIASLNVGNIGQEAISGSNLIGNLYPVLAIKGTVSDAELLMYERLVASLTPNGPVF